jgi:hypothetical protein
LLTTPFGTSKLNCNFFWSSLVDGVNPETLFYAVFISGISNEWHIVKRLGLSSNKYVAEELEDRASGNSEPPSSTTLQVVSVKVLPCTSTNTFGFGRCGHTKASRGKESSTASIVAIAAGAHINAKAAEVEVGSESKFCIVVNY